MTNFSQLICVEQEIYFIHKQQLRSLLTRSDLFSPYEQNYCQKKPTPLLSLAGLWCAKQAFVKTTKHRLGFSDFNYLDLEIRHHTMGQPKILLHARLADWFGEQNIETKIAISHTKTLAIAAILFCYLKVKKSEQDHSFEF
jgi:phosphopantetheine--protein transferase-like protein